MSTKAEQLCNFVSQHLREFNGSYAMGPAPKLPDFEINALDYLDYAEKELQAYQNESTGSEGNRHLINSIAHLKRAINCQLDAFLHTFALQEVFSANHLGIDKKFEFLRTIGIFNTRSLARLNTIRNKMEQDYAMPNIRLVEVYYDLVSSFVAALQRATMLSHKTELELTLGEAEEQVQGYLSMKYRLDGPSIDVTWELGEEKEKLASHVTELAEFSFFFKVFLLLLQKGGLVSDYYIESQLHSLPSE